MRVEPIRRISTVKRDGQPLTQERVLQHIKDFKGLDNESSTVVELNSTSELPAFLYDKTGKLK
ncbi:hypothetical protein DQT32_04370 [Salmonella enterica subsp. enterica serovar Braenderup]|nr:hypothetical protein [Salmonella enterica subsp. enterica serovar Braenderup]